MLNIHKVVPVQPECLFMEQGYLFHSQKNKRKYNWSKSSQI